MKDNKRFGRWAFWIVLVLFLWWDFARSPAIDLRQEPPLIAATPSHREPRTGQTGQGPCACPHRRITQVAADPRRDAAQVTS